MTTTDATEDVEVVGEWNPGLQPATLAAFLESTSRFIEEAGEDLVTDNPFHDDQLRQLAELMRWTAERLREDVPRGAESPA